MPTTASDNLNRKPRLRGTNEQRCLQRNLFTHDMKGALIKLIKYTCPLLILLTFNSVNARVICWLTETNNGYAIGEISGETDNLTIRDTFTIDSVTKYGVNGIIPVTWYEAFTSVAHLPQTSNRWEYTVTSGVKISIPAMQTVPRFVMKTSSCDYTPNKKGSFSQYVRDVKVIIDDDKYTASGPITIPMTALFDHSVWAQDDDTTPTSVPSDVSAKGVIVIHGNVTPVVSCNITPNIINIDLGDVAPSMASGASKEQTLNVTCNQKTTVKLSLTDQPLNVNQSVDINSGSSSPVKFTVTLLKNDLTLASSAGQVVFRVNATRTQVAPESGKHTANTIIRVAFD